MEYILSSSYTTTSSTIRSTMNLWAVIWIIVICSITNTTVHSDTDIQDVSVLLALKQQWQNVPPSWNRVDDPCGGPWTGITCKGSRVISIKLSSMGLTGTLPGDIQGISELQTLDLSYNKGMSGNLPPEIGSLANLTTLILTGCNFNGELPDNIGSLSNLVFLSLNSNRFIGTIPQTIGNLTQLYWLDLADNQLTGAIPVSNGSAFGLDNLVHTKHFHFGRNQLSGEIPPQLFNENMTMHHMLLDNNKFTGTIPTTLGLVTTLEVVRFDWNSLSGSVPSNINNLNILTDMLLSNNQLTGPIPDLTGMNLLAYLDMSNNSYDVSDVPAWVTALPSLTTLMMERTQIQGTVPTALFSLPQLQQVVLNNNSVSGILDLGATRSSQLKLVDLQNNNISAYTSRPADDSLELILVENPVCDGEMVSLQSTCILPQSNPSYSTPRNCKLMTTCTSNEASSPSCQCAYPYSGILIFRATQFSNLHNLTYYTALEQKLMTTFQSNKVPVDSVSLSNITRDASNYLDISLQIFPLGQDRFNRTDILSIGFIMSNQTFKPPSYYGPFTFLADDYTTFSDEGGLESMSKPTKKSKKKSLLGTILGSSIGGFLLTVLGIWQRMYVCKAVKCTFKCICQCCNRGCDDKGAHHDKHQRNESYNPTLEIERSVIYRMGLSTR